MFIEVYTSQLIDIPELALSLRISSIPWMLLNPEKSEDNQREVIRSVNRRRTDNTMAKRKGTKSLKKTENDSENIM